MSRVTISEEAARQAAWLATLDALRLIDLCREYRKTPEDLVFWRKFAADAIRHARTMRRACRRVSKHYSALSLRPANQPSRNGKPIYSESL